MDKDARRLAEDLRSLEPMQEKVVRLPYGWGCERAHKLGEIARAFAVSPATIREILQTAQQRLSLLGWSAKSSPFSGSTHGPMKGMIYRPPKTSRYFVTPYGWKVARLFSRLEGWVFRPAMATFTANDAVLPFALKRALDRVDAQLDALIYDAFPLPKAA